MVDAAEFSSQVDPPPYSAASAYSASHDPTQVFVIVQKTMMASHFYNFTEGKSQESNQSEN